MNKLFHKSNPGFLLVELLIALALFSTLILFSSLFFQQFAHNLAQTNQFNAQLTKAQNDLELSLATKTIPSNIQATPYLNNIKKLTVTLDQHKKLEVLINE